MSDQTPAEAVKATTEADPTVWEEQTAVTGRPNDIGPDGPPANSTAGAPASVRPHSAPARIQTFSLASRRRTSGCSGSPASRAIARAAG